MNNDDLDRDHWKTIGNLLVGTAWTLIGALLLLMLFSGAFLWSLILE
jgi:hypothetical protein